MAGADIILALKVLVSAATVLLLASLAALAAGRPRWHGRINTAFFALTLTTLVGFEMLLQFVDVKSAFAPAAREALRIHLYFAVPSALLLPIMFLTGIQRRKRIHRGLAVIFLALWTGTVVSGVFYIPQG